MDRETKLKGGASINFWALTLLGFSLLSLFLFPPLAKKRLETEDEVARLRLAVEALKEKRTSLKEEELALRHDPFYNEVLARRELRMLKPGEREVAVERPPNYLKKRAIPSQPPRAASSKFASLLESRPLRFSCLVIGLGLIITALLTSLQEESPKAAAHL